MQFPHYVWDGKCCFLIMFGMASAVSSLCLGWQVPFPHYVWDGKCCFLIMFVSLSVFIFLFFLFPAASERQLELGQAAIERLLMSRIYTHAMFPNADGDILRDQCVHTLLVTVCLHVLCVCVCVCVEG